jgi:ABC-type uncharacterized transport system substrate-binding protein
MPVSIGRREFIAALGGAAVAWPVTASAQQQATPVIGVVRISNRGEATYLEDALRQGLTQVGYVENQNVIIEWRWAEGQYERIPGILAELIGRRVAAIAVLGSPAGALIAKAATQTIPIVFSISTDPVELGLVARAR